MTVFSEGAPEQIRRNAALETLAIARTRPGADQAGGGGPQTLVSPSAAEPLPIYSIPLEVLAADIAPLAQVVQRGWRVLTKDEFGRQRIVDLKGTDADATPNRLHGPGAASQLEAAGAKAQEQAPDGTPYAARILEFARLGLSALWLHGEEDDRVVPLSPDGQLEPMDIFIAQAQLLARQRLERQNRDMAGGSGSTEMNENEEGG
jgi:hypothetical protein